MLAKKGVPSSPDRFVHDRTGSKGNANRARVVQLPARSSI